MAFPSEFSSLTPNMGHPSQLIPVLLDHFHWDLHPWQNDLRRAHQEVGTAAKGHHGPGGDGHEIERVTQQTRPGKPLHVLRVQVFIY